MIENLNLSPTQLDIHRAYIRLWKKTPVSQIRVNKICQETPIARSTFYAYYDNIEQLRNEVEDSLIAGLVATNRSLFVQQVQKIEDLNLVQSTLAYIDTEHQAFQAFLIDQVNVDFIHKWNQATKMRSSLLVK